VRDTIGWAGDIVVDPFFSISQNEIYWGFVVLDAVDTRADLLAAGEILDEAAIDRYSFIRDAFLQRRNYLVHDGNPPEDDTQDIFWDDDDEP
jgi:phospholipid-binding lipoprotein MlaA